MLQKDQEDQRMFNTLTIFALFIRCPVGSVKDGGDCPFAEVRNSSELDEKFLIAERLSEEKCREMLVFHGRCLAGAGHNRKI